MQSSPGAARQALVEFYTQCFPERLPQLYSIMERFPGQELDVLATFRNKYPEWDWARFSTLGSAAAPPPRLSPLPGCLQQQQPRASSPPRFRHSSPPLRTPAGYSARPASPSLRAAPDFSRPVSAPQGATALRHSTSRSCMGMSAHGAAAALRVCPLPPAPVGAAVLTPPAPQWQAERGVPGLATYSPPRAQSLVDRVTARQAALIRFLDSPAVPSESGAHASERCAPGAERAEQGAPESSAADTATAGDAAKTLQRGLLEIEQGKEKGVISLANAGALTSARRDELCSMVDARPRFDFYKVLNPRKELLPLFDETFDKHHDALVVEQDMNPRPVVRRPQDLHRGTRLPSGLRPAVTLLRLLGRKHTTKDGYPNYNWEDMIAAISEMSDPPAASPKAGEAPPDAPALDLDCFPESWRAGKEFARCRYNGVQETLVDLPLPVEAVGRQRGSELITVDADSMDDTAREGYCQLYESICDMEGIPAEQRYLRHPAKWGLVRRVPQKELRISRAVFGDGAFTVTVEEVCKLVASTWLTTSGDVAHEELKIPRGNTVPQAFVLELMKRFFFSQDYAWYFNGCRTVRLSRLAAEGSQTEDIKEMADSVHRMLKNLHKDINSADSGDRRGIENMLESRGSFLEWGTKYISAEGKEEKASGALQKLALQHCRRQGLCQRLCFLLDKEGHRECIPEFKRWHDTVLANPQWLGFDDQEHAGYILGRAAVQLTTEVCLSQQGYFILGAGEGSNQLRAKTRRPVVFLSIAAIDMGTAPTTRLEAPDFFERSNSITRAMTQGWSDFREGGEQRLRNRLRSFYATVFTAAQKHKVTHPSMLPIGLGVFVANLRNPEKMPDGTKRDLKMHDATVRMYFEAQFGLLCEKDWGFDTYFLSTMPAFQEMAKDVLQQHAEKLLCHVVLHNRDAKFIAIKVADYEDRPDAVAGFLNPSDCRATLMGSVGMFWELGRGVDYVGEEDFGATTTGVLGDCHIAGRSLGVRDIHVPTDGADGQCVVKLRPTADGRGLQLLGGCTDGDCSFTEWKCADPEGESMLITLRGDKERKLHAKGTNELLRDIHKQLAATEFKDNFPRHYQAPQPP